MAAETPHQQTLLGFKTVLTSRWGVAPSVADIVDVRGQRAVFRHAWNDGFAWEPGWRIKGVATSPPALETGSRPVTLHELDQTVRTNTSPGIEAWHVDGDQAFLRVSGDETSWAAVLEPGWKRVTRSFQAPDDGFVEGWLSGTIPPPEVPQPPVQAR